MPYNPIQGQGQGQGNRGPKFAKMADFKVELLHQKRQCACDQKTNGELQWRSQKFVMEGVQNIEAS